MSVCAAQDCDADARKRGLCDNHCQLARRNGGDHNAQFKFKRPPVGSPCLVCGSPQPGRRSMYCSGRCRTVAHRRSGVKRSHPSSPPPDLVQCSDCHTWFSVAAKPGQRKKRSDTKRCESCNARKTFRVFGDRHVSVGELRRRLGVECGICGSEVDFDLRAPNASAPSVDHVVPLALGGTADWSNVQLAHLGCNRRKNIGVARSKKSTGERRHETQRWKRLSRQIRRAEPDCRLCGAPAWQVDHIVAVVDGGAMWDPGNLQPLCRPCGNRKSRLEYQQRCLDSTPF